MTEVQPDVTRLDEKVTNTEENVTNLAQEADMTKAKAAGLAGEVAEQGQHLEKLENVVEGTVEKVEEIDKKVHDLVVAKSYNVTIEIKQLNSFLCLTKTLQILKTLDTIVFEFPHPKAKFTILILFRL